tara:strand:+ start:625 stop:735 length:111 start_codon:yes stop_codon:yes gene_type:complete
MIFRNMSGNENGEEITDKDIRDILYEEDQKNGASHE